MRSVVRYRGGTTHSSITLGGRRIGIKRPRARDLQEGQLALPSYLWASDRDVLDEATLAAIGAGVSSRRYAQALDRLPAGQDQSAVSRRFVALSSAQLAAWLSAEGLEETLTLTQLGVRGTLYRSLRTTNSIENLNGSIAHYSRNVKRWKDASMILRWVAFSLHEASRGFRAVRGFREIKALIGAMNERVQNKSQESSRNIANPEPSLRHRSTAFRTSPRLRRAEVCVQKMLPRNNQKVIAGRST